MRELRVRGIASSESRQPRPGLADSSPAAVPPPWMALLQRFYGPTGQPVPTIELLENDAVPQPYKGLLVHSADMTPTLEGFFEQPLALQVLGREVLGEFYLREVVLSLRNDRHPVEYGVIRIFLDHFPPRGRRRILEEQSPLGSILQSEAIAHLSWPQAFFRTRADARLQTVLQLAQPCDLFGRRNVLLDGSRRLLAEVIEILATVDNAVQPDKQNGEGKRNSDRQSLKHKQNGNVVS
jgi:hypothetical protein